MAYILSQHPGWPPCSSPLPAVQVQIEQHRSHLHLHWKVQENRSTFRCAVGQDGGPCWQDSCVELFVSMLDHSQDYLNIECNSAGFCLAARGPHRSQRTELTQAEYASIERIPSGVLENNNEVSWQLHLIIPATLLGLSREQDLTQQCLRGNLYKCADLSHSPHYLMLFPIHSPKPDFHRPEFFQRLI